MHVVGDDGGGGRQRIEAVGRCGWTGPPDVVGEIGGGLAGTEK